MSTYRTPLASSTPKCELHTSLFPFLFVSSRLLLVIAGMFASAVLCIAADGYRRSAHRRRLMAEEWRRYEEREQGWSAYVRGKGFRGGLGIARDIGAGGNMD